MTRGPKPSHTLQRNPTAPRWPNLVQIQHLCSKGLCAALLSIVATPAVMAAPPVLPALSTPASLEHLPGKVILVELVTPDLTAAKTFYAGLFGWTFHDSQLGETAYAEADFDGHLVAGLFQRPIKTGEHQQSAWLSFFSTGNVDATTKIALQHGAKVLFEPHDIPNLGRDAVLADPQGAVFAVLASSSGDPPDVLADPGEWIWSSLITTDPDTDAAFYQTLFDYDVFDLSASQDAQHYILASGDYARASVNSPPGNAVQAHPDWLNYVRVEDAVATAAKVVALGGHVLVEPRVDRHGGKVAVVADPLGAPFGLLEWSENHSKEMTK
jgi:predicted enzyme related to lactoylglutathione lyase